MQTELNLNDPRPDEGFRRWQRERREALEHLARKAGLPLGHEVEVWLRDGIRLRGKLCLREERLFIPTERLPVLELRVGDVPFGSDELEACVRLDAD